MTNKEAKEKLYMEWQKFLEDNVDYAGISEAYKMAFKALEQEPCEDAISREATLKPYKGLNDEDAISVWLIRKNIEQQPSINPQPKTDTLDKIRAEIEEEYGNYNICEWFEDYDYEENDISEYQYVGDVSDILAIIDKYKAESED